MLTEESFGKKQWYKKKPVVSYLRTFGCVAYAERVGPGVTKLADRSVRRVFLGYETRTKVVFMILLGRN